MAVYDFSDQRDAVVSLIPGKDRRPLRRIKLIRGGRKKGKKEKKTSGKGKYLDRFRPRTIIMQIGMRRAAYNVKNANFVNATIVSSFLFFFLRKAHSIFTVETWLFAAMINIIMSMSPDRGRTVKLEITENANFNAY